MPTTGLRTPADIIGAAAGLLGFAPTNSIVAYMLRRDPNDDLLVVRAALRFDVTITTQQATRFPATCNLRPADNDAAVLLAVCAPPRDRHAAAILDALRDALDTAGIPVIRRIMTHTVTDECQWYDPDSGKYGPTYPYTDSLITAQRILAGDRVSRARSDIEAEFAPIAPAPPVAIGDHGELVITTAEEISDALNGHQINRTLPTRAGIIITADVAVRDAMLTAALEHTQAAAELWTHIARRLRGQPRAEALTITAVAYCLLGDSIRAGIAAETALEEAEATHRPTPQLAALVLTALRAGIAPHEIRRVIPNMALKPNQD